jgi:hypothetical protein
VKLPQARLRQRPAPHVPGEEPMVKGAAAPSPKAIAVVLDP